MTALADPTVDPAKLRASLRMLGAGLSWLRPPAATGFIVSTLVAAVLALYIAYALQLESPASAATTVLIVSSASRGAILSKSLWRVAGSIVGATAAVVLIALFAQSPVLFVLGLALWLGMCTFVSSLLRYFRSYGAVLAGYTVVLVALGALNNPDQVFLVGMSRVAVVTIGVMTSSVIAMVMDSGTSHATIVSALVKLIADTARLLQTAADTEAFAMLPSSRSRVAAGLTSLDQILEFAAVEDAGFQRFADDLRLAAAELFAALTGGPRAIRLLAEAGAEGDPQLLGLSSELTALFGRIAEPAITLGRAPALLHGLESARVHIHAHLTDAFARRSLATATALAQASTLLGNFIEAIEALQALRRGAPRPVPVRLQYYVNPHTALRNGVRAAIAVTIGGLFWIESQWSSGGSMLAALGPITALLAQADSAAAASIGFLKGMVLAVIGAFLCTFGLMPEVSGFPMLVAVLLPFLAAGLIAGTKPSLAGIATPFLIFFVALSGLENPMRYDIAAFLNTAFAFVLGAACSMLAFRVLLPPNPVAEADLLAHSVHTAVLRLRHGTMPQSLVWENLQHQKLVRLSRRLAAFPALRTAFIEKAGGAVLIGRRLLELRHVLRSERLSAEAASRIRAVLASLRSHRTRQRTASLARQVAANLMTPADAPLAACQAAAILHDLAALLVLHGGFGLDDARSESLS